MKSNVKSFAAGFIACAALIAFGFSVGLTTDEPPITAETVMNAARLIGLEFTPAEVDSMLDDVTERRASYGKLRGESLPNNVPPALVFNPIPVGFTVDKDRRGPTFAAVQPPIVPRDLDDLAFASVAELGALIRTRAVSSEQLTKMYITRLKKHGPKLECVITITEDVALAQARRSDREIAQGCYRGAPGPVCLRANRLRIGPAELAERLGREGVATRPGQWARDCLVVISPRPNLYGLASHRPGLLEVQDEGSQLLGEIVGAEPGEEVLDLCAGAGGKTLQLAAAAGERGRVHAADPDAGRLERLRRRAIRAGAAGVLVHGAEPPPALEVDRALVDAPCSELGALRRGPDLRFRLDPATFAPLSTLQRSLLARAARSVRRGGRLVYATCTFRREENEEVALAFEAAHPDAPATTAFDLVHDTLLLGSRVDQRHLRSTAITRDRSVSSATRSRTCPEPGARRIAISAPEDGSRSTLYLPSKSATTPSCPLRLGTTNCTTRSPSVKAGASATALPTCPTRPPSCTKEM